MSAVLQSGVLCRVHFFSRAAAYASFDLNKTALQQRGSGSIIVASCNYSEINPDSVEQHFLQQYPAAVTRATAYFNLNYIERHLRLPFSVGGCVPAAIDTSLRCD